MRGSGFRNRSLRAAHPKATAPTPNVVDDLLRRASALQREGRLDEAEEAAIVALDLQPGHGEMLLRLGVIRAQQRRLEEAATLLKKGLAAVDSAEGWNNLGLVLQNLGRSVEAVAAYEQAITLRPDYAIAFNNLGAALAALQRYAEGIEHYRSALNIAPNYAEALNNLGAALHANGRSKEAVEQFEAAIKVRRGFTEARLNLGQALAALDRHKAAIDCYKAALKAQPDDPAIHVALADVLRPIGRSGEAASHYKRALAVAPDLAPAHAGLANACLALGLLKEAEQHIERALSIDPHRSVYFQTLTRLKKLAPQDPHLKAMLVMAADKTSPDDVEAINLHFALGKALADIGRNEDAFSHLLTGNKLKRKSISYNEARTLGQIDRIRITCTAEFMRRRMGGGNPAAIPIFIVGMPRSGSTLVEQILAAHPAVFGAGEVECFSEALGGVGLNGPEQRYPDSLASSSAEMISALGVDYLARLRTRAKAEGTPSSVTHISDKMLNNFRYIGLIHLALPNARIIHTRRDPIDTCLSGFSIQFAALSYSYDLGELGRYYHAYATLMEHWRSVLPPDAFLDVHYENLVQNFDEESRRLLAFCNLDWDERCGRFYEAKRPVLTASMAQVRQPLYQDAIRRWRPDSETLRPLLDAIGGRDQSRGQKIKSSL